MCLSATFVKALVVLSAFCPTAVTISGTGAYWNVGTLAEPRFTG